MNKNDLRNIGLFLITPFPQKFHFEGVDNRRASLQLMLIGLALMVVPITVYTMGTLVKEEIQGRREVRHLNKLENQIKDK